MQEKCYQGLQTIFNKTLEIIPESLDNDSDIKNSSNHRIAP